MEYLALLVGILCGGLAVVQPTSFDFVSPDPFSLQQDDLTAFAADVSSNATDVMIDSPYDDEAHILVRAQIMVQHVFIHVDGLKWPAQPIQLNP